MEQFHFICKNVKINRNVLLIILVLFLFHPEITFSTIVDTTVSVATNITHSENGNITIIAAKDIEMQGCRDLTDVLNMVPGYSFDINNDGIRNVSYRGFKSGYGRIPILINGIEINELLFSSYQHGNHFNIHSIQRVEVYRGASVTSQNSTVGAINIITKAAKELDGISANITTSLFPNELKRTNAGFSAGVEVSEDISFALHAFAGDGHNTQKTFVYNPGKQLKDNFKIDSDPASLILKSEIYDFDIDLIYDYYRSTSANNFSISTMNDIKIESKTIIANLGYSMNILDNLVLRPKIAYKYFHPFYPYQDNWENVNYELLDECFFNRSVERISGGFNLNYKPIDGMEIICGGELFNDKATDNANRDDLLFINGKKEIDYTNSSFFGSASYKNYIADINIEARFDNYEKYGSFISPAVSVSKNIGDISLWVGYGQSRNFPGIALANQRYYIDNDMESEIEPETFKTIEFGASYLFADDMLVRANIFHTKVENPITIFTAGMLRFENYQNSGFQGFELEYNWKPEWGYINGSLTYQSNDGFVLIPDNTAEAGAFCLRGIESPEITAKIFAGISLTNQISLNSSLIYLSSRNAYYIERAYIDYGYYTKTDPDLYLNVFININDFPAKNFRIGLGAYDILNTNEDYTLPFKDYNSTHSPSDATGYALPLPGLSREFVLSASYNIALFKE